MFPILALIAALVLVAGLIIAYPVVGILLLVVVLILAGKITGKQEESFGALLFLGMVIYAGMGLYCDFKTCLTPFHADFGTSNEQGRWVGSHLESHSVYYSSIGIGQHAFSSSSAPYAERVYVRTRS